MTEEEAEDLDVKSYRLFTAKKLKEIYTEEEVREIERAAWEWGYRCGQKSKQPKRSLFQRIFNHY
jgi:hypothetical protein